MILLPEPREINIYEDKLSIDNKTVITIATDLSYRIYKAVCNVRDEIEKKYGIILSITKSDITIQDSIRIIKVNKINNVDKPESYELKVDNNGILLTAADEAGIFYGIQTLKQLILTEGLILPHLEIKDWPHFRNRGYLFDVTRGKVPSLDTLKLLVDRLAYFKINQLQLYMEHTFAFESMSEVLVKTDSISAEDIIELDEYCHKRHVELVPCMATFSHLYDVLSTYSFGHLSEMPREVGLPFTWYNRMCYHMLDASNEKSFKLIKSMLDQFIPLFRSSKFNICCDETFDLGRGRSREKAEEIGISDLYAGFVTRIADYVSSYGKKVMMWSDIVRNHSDMVCKIPNDIIFLNWAYYDSTKEEWIKLFKDYNLDQYVCPSVCGFSRLVNQYDLATININDMVNYGRKYGAIGFINTDWGDSGHVNFFASGMPGMALGGALSWNPDSEFDGEKSDAAVSCLVFGDKDNKIMPLLRQLCRQDKIIWNDIAFWRDEYIHNKKMFNSVRENFEECTFEELTDAYTISIGLQKKLQMEIINIGEGFKQDLKELQVSAIGVALMQALSQFIKLYYLKQNKYKKEMFCCKHNELAVSLEEWEYMEFRDLWRARNKESELYRIRELVIDVCSFLRTRCK